MPERPPGRVEAAVATLPVVEIDDPTWCPAPRIVAAVVVYIGRLLKVPRPFFNCWTMGTRLQAFQEPMRQRNPPRGQDAEELVGVRDGFRREFASDEPGPTRMLVLNLITGPACARSQS